jgi:hypothetical protein
MHVVQLLGVFALAENIEVVGALLPERRRKFGLPQWYLTLGLLLSAAAPGDTLFENLHGYRNISLSGFADQEVEVIGNDHIAPNYELVFLPHFFEDFEKQIATVAGAEEGLTMIAAAGNEVFVATGVKTFQTSGHGEPL